MTEQQIAELRRWCNDTEHPASIDVEKVLDEREALLAALKDVYDNAATDSPDMWQRAADAITKAEEG